MNIDAIWASLEETGKFISEPLGCDFAEQIDEVKTRLYADAKEYGVRLAINWSFDNNRFYVYLRKNAG